MVPVSRCEQPELMRDAGMELAEQPDSIKDDAMSERMLIDFQ